MMSLDLHTEHIKYETPNSSSRMPQYNWGKADGEDILRYKSSLYDVLDILTPPSSAIK